jgi:hypothetical protein
MGPTRVFPLGRHLAGRLPTTPLPKPERHCAHVATTAECRPAPARNARGSWAQCRRATQGGIRFHVVRTSVCVYGNAIASVAFTAIPHMVAKQNLEPKLRVTSDCSNVKIASSTALDRETGRPGPATGIDEQSERGMNTASSHRTRIFGSMPLLLILLTFCCDFGHGIALGQYNIGFHPMYRLRQSAAIAISRMQEPPLHGYLAYQSVIDTLNENGFAIYENDKGRHLDQEGWSVLFKDPARMERAFQKAKDTAVDPALGHEMIRGNEVAYSDYVYAAFELFGLRMSSFYYLYFLLLGIACALFVIEFRKSPFLLFLLTTYLGGLFFLQNYALSMGDQLATLANSRLFEALSLLPAMHVFLVVWRRVPLRASTLITTAIQSALLAFLVDTRFAAQWQIAMILATGAVLFFVGTWRRRPWWLYWRRELRNGVWAAGVALVMIAAQMTQINLSVDASYKTETKYHGVWPTILAGLLESSAIQREYLGKVIGPISPIPDSVIEDAVNYDLTKRHDTSSPLAEVYEGRIVVSLPESGTDPESGWSEYERLTRTLAIKIARQHPIEVLAEFYTKAQYQIEIFRNRNAISFRNLLAFLIFTAVGAALWLTRGAGAVTTHAVLKGIEAALVVLVFAAVPPMIEPSNFSVGTLLSFLIAITIAIPAFLGLAAKAIGSNSLLEAENDVRT